MPVPRAARRGAIDSLYRCHGSQKHRLRPYELFHRQQTAFDAILAPAGACNHRCLRPPQHVPLDPACAGPSDPYTRTGSPTPTDMAHTTAQTDQPAQLRVYVHSAGAAVCTLANACCGRISAPSRLKLNRAGCTVPTTPRRGTSAPLGAALTLRLPLRALCCAPAPAQKIREIGVQNGRLTGGARMLVNQSILIDRT